MGVNPVGDGGTRPPTFRRVGDTISNVPPTFRGVEDIMGYHMFLGQVITVVYVGALHFDGY